MQAKKDTTITVKGIITIAVGAFVTGIVGTTIAMAGIANTDHFTILNHSERIKTVEAQKLDKEIYQANQRTEDEKTKAILDSIAQLNGKVDKILVRLNIISLVDLRSFKN